MSNRRATIQTNTARGADGERIAQRYYEMLGYSIVEKNFYNPVGKKQGEIDLIARKDGSISFVEVKTRTITERIDAERRAYVSALQAISPLKKKNLGKVVQWYLFFHREYLWYRLQLDVCVILLLDNKPKYVKILSNAVDDLF